MWGENISNTTNYNIKIAYSLYVLSDRFNQPNVYYVKSNCTPLTTQSICLAGIDNEGLSFNLMNLTQSSGNVYGVIGSSEIITPQYLSMDGTKMWSLSESNAKQYSINYNVLNNTISKSLINTYLGNWFIAPSGISENGDNLFSNNYNQYGLMTNINNPDSDQYMDWTYGMDGQLYTTGFNTGYYYIMNQTPNAALMNETKSRIAPQVSNTSFLKGVSANGNLWTREARGSYSCLNKNNGYAVTSMNLDSLVDTMTDDIGKIGAGGYRNKFVRLNYYTDLKGNPKSLNSYYKINIDNCQVESNNYLSEPIDLTDSFGLVNGYVLPKSGFSDGTNGN